MRILITLVLLVLVGLFAYHLGGGNLEWPWDDDDGGSESYCPSITDSSGNFIKLTYLTDGGCHYKGDPVSFKAPALWKGVYWTGTETLNGAAGATYENVAEFTLYPVGIDP